MTVFERIRTLRRERGMTQQELAERIGMKTGSAINKIEMGLREVNGTKLVLLADALGTTPSFLLNGDEGSEKAAESEFKSFLIPTFDSVAAGFGAFPDEKVTGFIPLPFRSEAEANESLCVRVTGDSMEPLIFEGDFVQVRKQPTVDSGDIAVLFLDDEALLKKIRIEKGFIELISFNAYYPPRRFEGADLLRLRILGKVRRIIRELD